MTSFCNVHAGLTIKSSRNMKYCWWYWYDGCESLFFEMIEVIWFHFIKRERFAWHFQTFISYANHATNTVHVIHFYSNLRLSSGLQIQCFQIINSNSLETYQHDSHFPKIFLDKFHLLNEYLNTRYAINLMIFLFVFFKMLHSKYSVWISLRMLLCKICKRQSFVIVSGCVYQNFQFIRNWGVSFWIIFTFYFPNLCSKGYDSLKYAPKNQFAIPISSSFHIISQIFLNMFIFFLSLFFYLQVMDVEFDLTLMKLNLQTKKKRTDFFRQSLI